MRTKGRKALIQNIRKRYARQLAAEERGTPEASKVFNENALTLGFARRFATYKRPNLLLHDPDRLIRLLGDRQRPVQLILAGKAHPQDLAGQGLIKEWNDFIKRAEVRNRVIFLTDYDMQLTQELVQGVDLWINTPRRPWEACGTSGMKVLVNGGLNLSELDGWWAEAYVPEVGWAIGDGKEHGQDSAWDVAEADALYGILENEVIPEFYRRNEAGIPTQLLARVRESMARLTPEFSAGRAIREYTENHYLPAAAGFRERAANDSQIGEHLLRWQQETLQHWSTARFGALSIHTDVDHHFFKVQVFIDNASPDDFRVELYASTSKQGESSIEEMTACKTCASGSQMFSAQIPAIRPASDYTPRIVPYHPNASVPLEAQEIVWQR
jgi:starch phosphorylase